MCGINGIVSNGENIISIRDYYDAHLKLAHRGPDDEGFVVKVGQAYIKCKGNNTIKPYNDYIDIRTVEKSSFVFGHCRLAILDLSARGHQPLTDESGNYILTYNGEVYNYVELREELKCRYGETFYSESDSEVVLKAIKHWGKEAFAKFNGMWALAFYDKAENRLIISRDRIGVKPLFYHKSDKMLIFASEIKFIRCYLKNQMNVNFKTVAKYLDKCVVNDGVETFWNGIYELMPGCVAEYNDNKFSVEEYWKYRPCCKVKSKDDAKERFDYLFKDAVKIRLQSDVGLGGALSGGLDSNLIIQTAFSMLAPRKKINLFSVVFDEEMYSEYEYIKQMNSNENAIIHYIKPKSDVLLDVLDDYLYHLEQPSRSFSEYSLYLLYKYVKNKTDIRVVLNGQGADVCFAGYTHHYYWKIAQLLREKRYLDCVRELNRFCEIRKVGLLNASLYSLYNFYRMEKSDKDFNAMLFDEVKRFPLREYLLYDDRLSMAFGIESRAPFVDYRLIELAFNMYHDLKIKNGINKLVPREYARGKVDSKIVDRKDKMGFISPQERWQKCELKGYIETHVNSFNDKVRRGEFPRCLDKNCITNINMVAWDKVWRVACFNRWYELNGRSAK